MKSVSLDQICAKTPPQFWSKTCISATTMTVALAAIALTVGILGILTTQGVALGPINTLGAFIPSPAFGFLGGLGGFSFPAIGLALLFKNIDNSTLTKKPSSQITLPTNDITLPTYETVSSIYSKITSEDYKVIQQTVAGAGEITEQKYISKTGGQTPYSLTIMLSGVVYIHLGKNALLGTGGFKKVCAAIFLNNNFATGVAEARIIDSEDVEKAKKEDGLAHELASEHIFGGSDKILEHQGKSEKKTRFMQPLMVTDGLRFCRQDRPLAAILTVIEDATLGLQEMHEKRYVHRDLKPNNIFIDKNGRGKVADLGFALSFNDCRLYNNWTKKQLTKKEYDRITKKTQFQPRQYSESSLSMYSEKPSPERDLFSLGATIEAMLKKRTDVPEEITTLCTALKSKRPADRPKTPAVLQILSEAKQQLSV